MRTKGVLLEINNLTKEKIEKKFFARIAEKILVKEGKKEALISVALVPEKKMRELNYKYRKKDKVTNVLAFEAPKIFLNKNNIFLGEIILCPSYIRKQISQRNLSFRERKNLYRIEFLRCYIHGILHLLGYKHSDKMQKKEDYYL